MIFTRKGFTQVVGNSYAGLGFPTEGPSIYEFPTEMFIPGSDLTPIRENIDKVVYGLTKWEPKTKQKGVYAQPKTRVEGKDYQQAVYNLNLLFLKNLWGDGLPVLPPTEERVNWLLRGTDLPRDKVVTKILPRGGIATVEMLAANLAMAGGRPEYMPVLIAAVEAMAKPGFLHQGMNATTCSVYPAVVVNGQVARQIRLNSGYGCLGPDPVHPAGASIGRAIRLILQDMGGAIPGTGTMAIFGSNRFTNIVFAEDEEGLPQGWAPLSVDRGFAKGTNLVTVAPVATTDNINGANAGTAEVAKHTLDRSALIMWANYGNVIQASRFTAEGAPGILVYPLSIVKGLADAGWTKEKVKNYMWEKARVPWSIVKADSYFQLFEAKEIVERYGTEGKPLQIAMTPKNIMIVVAGGEQGGHGYWMRAGVGGAPQHQEIKLPAKWNDLLKEAENELGPIAAK